MSGLPHTVPVRTLLVVGAVVMAFLVPPPTAGAQAGPAGPDGHATGRAPAVTRLATTASVSGTVAYSQPTNLYHPDGATASWNVSGLALPLRQEAPLVGITDLTGLYNSDELYVHSELSGVQASWPQTACDDGTGAVTQVELAGIADPSSAISFASMRVNKYTGTGKVAVNVAVSPTAYAEMFAPGTVNIHYHSECYSSVTDWTVPLPVMGEESSFDPLGSWWASQDHDSGTWRLARTSGAWVVDQHRVLSSTSYDSADETMHLTFSGSLPAFKAGCAFPSVRRLHPATTFSQADAIVHKGGFSNFKNVKKYSVAAPKGHFFVAEGVGNLYGACGQQHLHVVKSLGWPS